MRLPKWWGKRLMWCGFRWEPRDLWIGVFWTPHENLWTRKTGQQIRPTEVYVCPLPCCRLKWLWFPPLP